MDAGFNPFLRQSWHHGRTGAEADLPPSRRSVNTTSRPSMLDLPRTTAQPSGPAAVGMTTATWQWRGNDIRHLERLWASPDIRLISVDLYDTLLLRRCRPEFIRFHDIAQDQHAALCGTKLCSPGVDSLYRARLRAHKECYDQARAQGGEARHDQILAGACALAGLPATAIAVLAEAEIAYESMAVRRHRRLTAALTELRRHKPVVLTSDMYLPGSAIRRILAAATPSLADLPLFVSADVGLTKRYGELFHHMAAAMGVAPAGILHLGDHPVSDVERARQTGLNAAWLPRPWWWRTVLHWRERRIRRRLSRAGMLRHG